MLQVYVWDVARRCCVHRFADDGCVTGTALAVSPGHQYVACGSASGVVNVYAADKLRAGVSTTAPQPDKSPPPFSSFSFLSQKKTFRSLFGP